MKPCLVRLSQILLVCLLLSGLALPIFAEEETVFIETGTEWIYQVTDTAGFGKMDSDWMEPTYSPDGWSVGNSPFGDRINGANATLSGWSGDQHGLFARHTFKLRSATVWNDYHFYLQIFYDNTIHIYLNGSEIFSHDNGGSGDWVDNTVLIELTDITPLLQKGDNVLAVSVLDNAGGRELELSFFASQTPIQTDNPPVPPVTEEGDFPAITDPPVGNVSPDDVGSSIPFTKAPPAESGAIETVYVTAKSAPMSDPAHSTSPAPWILVGASSLLSAGMVALSYWISRKGRPLSGGNP